MTLVYFARPIDFAPALLRVLEVEQELVRQKVLAYRPDTAFLLPSDLDVDSSIADANNAVLSQCQGMVAMFPEARSIGVGMEIQQAQQLGIPVVVVTGVAQQSWSLAGIRNARILDVSSEDFASQLAQAIGWLKGRMRECLAPPPESLRVRLDHDCADLPRRTYEGDAGFDLFTSVETMIPAGGFADVPCGIAIELPKGCWGMITGRSSTLRKHDLLVSMGVIDNGWRGPIYAGVRNLSDQLFKVKVGMRLAQLIPLPLLAANMQAVQAVSLTWTDRGTSGFGSSGE